MKMTAFLLFFGVISLIAGPVNSQNTKISLEMRDASIASVLNEIENISEFYFLYSSKLIDVEKKVNIMARNEPIKDILTEILPENVRFVVSDQHIVLTPVEMIPEAVVAMQQNPVTGKVTDATTGEPLPGVTVLVKGTTIGIYTDADGNYNIGVPQNATTLVFSFIGYETMEIAIGGQTVVNVTLQSEVTDLDEVVVIGYGVQKKSVVTGAISSVTSEQIQNASNTKAGQALQGKTAGVQVISTSGAPGAEMKIRVRGYSSNGTADPLYIVDGVKTSDISYLDPGDISAMEVLKDAASAAIYGAEGGNGVIMITTKQGKKGSSSITYDFQYALKSVGKLPDMADAEEYATYTNEAGSMTIDLNNLPYNTNWLKESFESGMTAKHHLSFSSGTEKSNFFASLSALNDDGIIVMDKDQYKRYSARLNADTKLTDWLKVGYNASIAYTKRNAIPESGVIVAAVTMDPLTPVVYPSFSAIPASMQNMINNGTRFIKDENGNYYGVSQYITKNPVNPYATLAVLNSDEKSYFTQGNMYAELQPIKDLTITSRFGYEMRFQNTHSWSPVYYYNNFQFYNNATSTSDNNSILSHWQWENFASYAKNLGDHNFNLLAGISAESIDRRFTNAQGGPMIREDANYADLSYISGQANDFVSGASYLDRKFSMFGRVTYDYLSKYLFQASIRRDGAGSSYLPPANRFGIFPSFSAGWVFTEEDFFPDTFINFGKLRASWGMNGSLSNLGNYDYMSSITSTGTAALLYTLGDGKLYTVSVPNRLDNPNLRWEASVQTDIGVDLRMFDSRLTLTMDYFYKKTTDLITPNTPPLESGNTPSAVNGGDVLNSGVEIDLGYRNEIGDFKYGVRGNISFLHNEVTYLNPSIQRISSTDRARAVITAFEQGHPVWYMRGYETAGVNETTGQAIIVDQNSDGLINENDKVMLGSAIPSITYGANIDFAWKGLDFIMSLQGQSGNEGAIVWYRSDWPGSNFPMFLYNDRWTPSNTDASAPKAGFEANTYMTDLFVFDGSFMRIKQIQLGYSLPAALMKKIQMKSARIYVSLDDYFTFTTFPGMDPELGSTTNSSIGLDQGYYPITKKVLFGLSVTF